MITDALLWLSGAPGATTGQAVTATAVSTNTIDLSQPRDVGAGEELYARIFVDTTVTAAGAATVRFEVITSASADLSTPTVIGASGDIGKADLVLGARVSIPIPANMIRPLGQRYLGLRYTVSTGPLTAGTFTALVTTADDNPQKSYPSGFTVL
jgi:hypothetical protein